MKVFNKKFMYDGFMDDEVLKLVNAMNCLPGIKTMESCWGHGSGPFQVFFQVDKNEQDGLFFLTRCVDRKYWKYGYLWKIELCVGDSYDNSILPIRYLLTSGPIVGEDAYLQSLDLVTVMNDHINNENFLSLYELNVNKFITEKVKLTT